MEISIFSSDDGEGDAEWGIEYNPYVIIIIIIITIIIIIIQYYYSYIHLPNRNGRNPATCIYICIFRCICICRMRKEEITDAINYPSTRVGENLPAAAAALHRFAKIDQNLPVMAEAGTSKHTKIPSRRRAWMKYFICNVLG